MKRVIVVGGSAGAISALCTMLKAIPRNFRAPILVVIHIGEETSTLSSVLQRCSVLKVIDPQTPEPVALRKLKERQIIQESLARNSATVPGAKKRFKENAATAANDIKLLEEVLTRL